MSKARTIFIKFRICKGSQWPFDQHSKPTTVCFQPIWSAAVPLLLAPPFCVTPPLHTHGRTHSTGTPSKHTAQSAHHTALGPGSFYISPTRPDGAGCVPGSVLRAPIPCAHPMGYVALCRLTMSPQWPPGIVFLAQRLAQFLVYWYVIVCKLESCVSTSAEIQAQRFG